MLDFTPDMISIENSSYMIISDKQISQPSLGQIPKAEKVLQTRLEMWCSHA